MLGIAPTSRITALALLALGLACGDDTSGATEGVTSASTTGDTAGSTSVATAGSTGGTATTAATTAVTTGSTTDTTTGGDPIAEPPAIHPDDPHRLTRGGALWVPVGYYPGAALNMTGPDYGGDFLAYDTELLDRLGDRGVDLMRVWINWGNLGNKEAPVEDQWDRHIHHPFLRTGPGDAIDGMPRVDVTKIDPAYLDLLEAAVDHAASRGVVLQLILLDCWHAGFGLQYGFGELDYFAAGNNVNGLSFADEDEWLAVDGPIFAANRALALAVVERIGDRDNLIWETCNEKKAGDHSNPSASAADPFHSALAAAIHAREDALGYPRHLVIPVDLPEHRTVAGHKTPTNGAPGEESVAAMHDRLAGEQWAWSRPLISDNDCCGGEPDADLIRRKAWAALTAGAHVDVFNNELFKAAVVGNQNTDAGMRYVGLVGAFVRDLGVDLVGMAPADDLVTGEAWALARLDPGREEFVVYAPKGGALTVSDLPAAVTATWFGPRDGSTLDAGDGPDFVAPDGEDWALHIRGR